jgi:hypothetical protein
LTSANSGTLLIATVTGLALLRNSDRLMGQELLTAMISSLRKGDMLPRQLYWVTGKGGIGNPQSCPAKYVREKV